MEVYDINKPYIVSIYSIMRKIHSLIVKVIVKMMYSH